MDALDMQQVARDSDTLNAAQALQLPHAPQETRANTKPGSLGTHA